MPTKKVRILSVAVGGGLVFTGVTAAVITPGHAPARAALAANTASSPPVNLDNCPMLSEGYQGGCVSQLQTELNTISGLNLPVDGTFGSTTKKAVETFQQEHNIVPADGIVGPQTKAALDNPGSSSAGTPTGQLNPGQQITSGTQIASPDGKFALQMQSDGNLVLRAPGNIPIGDTHTTGHDGTIAVMQTDGNFVLRAPGNIPVWASGTDGHPGTVLQVQDDGNVVLYAPGHQVLRVLFPTPTVPSAPTAPPATAPASAAVILDQCPALALGYHGGCVGELQIELNEDIGTNLAINDDFGQTTKAAVVAYQQSMGLTADGMVGPETKGALDVSNSVATPSPGPPSPRPPLDQGSTSDAGKSVSECLGEVTTDKGLEDFARKQAAARGYKVIELSPWFAGAEMAGCILLGI